MQNETAQTTSTQEVKAKRTAKNSVFLDLFKDKRYLLALYKTLHPEDTKATEENPIQYLYPKNFLMVQILTSR